MPTEKIVYKLMQENLVIVESPAKAKKIEEFLGKDYKMMNKKLQRLTKAVKYTTMGDIWREIDEGARPAADKRDIVEAAKRRWRQIGRNVRP